MRESLSGHVVPWVVGGVDLDPVSFCQGSQQTWKLLCVLLPCRLGGVNILLFVIVLGFGFALGLFVFSLTIRKSFLCCRRCFLKTIYNDEQKVFVGMTNERCFNERPIMDRGRYVR